MKFDVCIVDYDMGNLFSIKCACQKVGLQTIISSNPKDLLESKCIILPGVGAFNKAMSNLRKKRLVNLLSLIQRKYFDLIKFVFVAVHYRLKNQ